MTLNNQKEYEDALESLSALLEEQKEFEFEDDIEELTNAILEYEKEHYIIQDSTDWALVE